MEETLAALRALAARYWDSPSDDARELSWEIEVLLHAAPAPAYQYRHHPAWDATWLDLDEAQLDIVLERGHTIERRPLAGGWERVGVKAQSEATP